MKHKRLKKGSGFALILILSAILLYGCNESLIKKYARPDLDSGTIKRLAVLPFENLTTDEFADEKVRSLVIIDLLSRGLDVIEPGEVLRALNELKIRSVSSLSAFDMKNLGTLLDVDILLTGSVTAFEIRKGISVSSPEVTLNMMLYEAQTGDIIWSVWNTDGGPDFATRHFGVENDTLGEVSRKVIMEAIDSLY